MAEGLGHDARLGAAGEQLGRLALVQPQAAGVARVEILQTEALALGNAEWINVFLNAVEDLSHVRHGTSLLRTTSESAHNPRLHAKLSQSCMTPN